MDYYGFWVPKYKRDMKYLERIEQRVANLIRGLHHLSYEERLQETCLFSMEKIERSYQYIQIC